MRKEIYGSIVWFISTLFVVYAFSLNTATAVFTDAIKTSLNLSNISTSIATGSFIFAFACMQIPAGYLLDRFNARFVVAFGVFLLAFGNFIISFSHNLIIFCLANLLQGLGAAFAFIAAAILISQWFKPKLFPILFGFTQMLSCILTGIIHYYFSILLKTHTWNEIYRGLTIFGFILLMLTILIVKTPAGYRRGQILTLRNTLTTVIKNKQLWLCCFAAGASFGILLAYAGLWYMQVQSFYSVENLEAVLISGIIFFGIGIGTPLLGWLSNVVKSRTEVIHVTLVLGTMALLLGLYLPHFNINTLIIIKIVSFFIGFFLSGSMLFYTIVSEFSSENTRGVAISLLNTTVFLFNTIMLIIPYLFITTSSQQFFTYLWILPFFCLFSILLLYFIKDTY